MHCTKRLFLCINYRHKSGMKYGYARVSTDGQSIDAQVRQLTKAGCKRVFREVASGAKTDRAQLRRLLDQLEAGDVVTVTRLDRLARSTRDLLNVLATITGKNAGFKSIGDTWADTPTAHGRLMLTVLGGLAEFERDLIRARTGEGRARAKARGVKLGRKPKLTEHQKREALRRRDVDGEPLREIAQLQCLAQHNFPANGSNPARLLALWTSADSRQSVTGWLKRSTKELFNHLVSLHENVRWDRNAP